MISHSWWDEKPTDVYWVYDAEDRLLYVGMSYQLEQRLLSHHKNKDWWPRAARIETETFPNRPLAREREWDAIWNDKPLFNKAVKKPPTILPPITKRDALASVTEIGGAS